MPAQRKTVFLHVGCRKSGTTALQTALRRSAGDLQEIGLAQPLLGRARALPRLVEPLRRAIGGDHAEAREAVARLARRIGDSEHPRHLVTIEALAELPAEVTSLVVEGLSEFDTRLIVTVRPWALTVPSEWQQLLKSRFTGDFLEYARDLRRPREAAGPAPEADRFRRRQDVADVVRRWRAADHDLAVHVVLVPADPRARPNLHDMFSEVVGIGAGALPVPRRGRNPSLTRENAEVLRRLNLALGNRLRNVQGDYRYSVRKWIGVRTMMKRSRGSRLRLPRELEAWASAEGARQLAELHDLGCEVLGDPEAFVRPKVPERDYVPVTEAEVAESSVALLADLAQGHARSRRRSRKQVRQRKLARARKQRGGPTDVPAGGARRLRRKLRSGAGRVVSRLLG